MIVLILLLGIYLLALEKVPNFTLEDIDGNTVKFSELLEKGPIILNFWASWCKPCMKELPILNNLKTKYDTLITVVCVSADRPRDFAKARSIIKSQKFSFLTLFDQNREVQKLFNITSIPRIFIISQDGEIIYDHTGYKRGDEKHLEEELIKMMSDTLISSMVWQMGKTPKFVVYDESPIPIKKVQLEYSKTALPKLDGTVILQVEVFEDGSVGAVEVTKSLQSEPGRLDELAVQAMKQWKFIPAKNEGKAVSVWITVPIKFTD